MNGDDLAERVTIVEKALMSRTGALDDRVRRIERDLLEGDVASDNVALTQVRMLLLRLEDEMAGHHAELDGFLALLAGTAQTVAEAADRLRQRTPGGDR